jgi:WD40 repeat protein
MTLIFQVVLNEHDASVNALATHPFLPHLVTGGYACKLKLWDYDTKYGYFAPESTVGGHKKRKPLLPATLK